VIDALEFELEVFTRIARARLSADAGYVALQAIPGIGPTLAAVFVAEIGDVHRFAGPAQLASWCGLTPKHRESDTHGSDHQAGLAAGALGLWEAAAIAQQTAPAVEADSCVRLGTPGPNYWPNPRQLG
jgi:transposase